MTLGPRRTPAAAGRGRIRAAHADRERAIDTLKDAFVQGRLTKDEFDLRVSQTLAARTYADLSTVTSDIPARLTPVAPVSQPKAVTRPQPAMQARAPRSAGMTMAAFAVGLSGPAMLAAAALTGSVGVGQFAFVYLIFYFVGCMVAVSAGLDARARRRLRSYPPPRTHADRV